MRKVYRAAWPEGLAVLLGIVIIGWPGLHAAVQVFLRVYPYVVLALGLLLGWRFARWRLLFGLVTLTVADRALAPFATATALNTGAGHALRLLVGLLLPVNFGVLALLQDRGPLIRVGRWWAAAFVAQLAVATLAVRLAAPDIAYALELPLFPVNLERWMSLSQFPLLAFLAAAGFLAARAVRASDPTARGLFWGIVAAFVALNAGVPFNRTLYFATAGLALALAMVESSHSLAFQDELTGLPARRAFNQALEGLGGAYVVAMVDVDHFKQFNDRYGHEVGDQVLKLVARRLGEVGGGGNAFRYGGEEFAVVFPGLTLEEALPHLEAVRESVEVTTFTLRGADRPPHTPPPDSTRRGTKSRRRDISVTVSIGAAAGSSRGSTAGAVTEAADKALYRAKDSGRNRVARA